MNLLKATPTPISSAVMLAARKSATVEHGSGAVLEAMKSFYSSVDLSDLSPAERKEANALVTYGKDVNPLERFTYNIARISMFLNRQLYLYSRASFSGEPSLQAVVNGTNYLEEEVKALGAFGDDEDEKEELIEQVELRIFDLLYHQMIDHYIVREESDHFNVRFTLGSNPTITRAMMNAAGRTTNPHSTDLQFARVAVTNPALFNDVEQEAKQIIQRIEKLIGGSVESIGSNRAKADLPIGYDFSSLFGHYNTNSGEFDVLATSLEDADLARYNKYWGLTLHVGYTGKGTMQTNLGKLSALELIVLPNLRMSRNVAAYLTQSVDPTKVKLATLHAWVNAWQRDIFEGRNKQVPIINSLLDNFNFSKKKESLGIRSIDSRADANGMFVSFEGQYCYAPATSAVDESTIVAYEEAYNQFVKECADADEPVDLNEGADRSYLRNSPALAKLEELGVTLNNFQSCALISNWDMNICASVEPNNPAALNSVSITGGTKPNVIGTAELLAGPALDGFRYLTADSKRRTGQFEYHAMGEMEVRRQMAAIYAYLRINGKIDDIDDFLSKAGVAAPNGVMLTSDDFEFGIYRKVYPVARYLIDDACTKFGMKAAQSKDDEDYLRSFLDDITDFGIRRSAIGAEWDEFISEYNRFKYFFGLWSTLFDLGDSSHLHRWERDRFALTGQPLSDFNIEDSRYYLDKYGKTYQLSAMTKNYVVGRAFTDICREMAMYINSPKNIVLSHDDTAPKPHIGAMPNLPTFSVICEEVMPFLATFGHYLPNAEQIMEEAKEEQKKFTLDTSRKVAPVPGMKGEFQVFNHQNRALQLLDNEPYAAFLDISPGGGKTVIGLTDCLQLMAKGKVKLPLLVAPGNLIKNWIIDLNATVTEFKFNCIPITTKTVSKWGEEKLAQMIKSAPPNTIFYTDLQFIKVRTRKLSVQFLNHKMDIYANLEWMKQFDWDYILFDESHYLKNAKGADGGSVQSRLFGELTLRDSVKYIRLASGTIIHKDIDDIIGQTRLFDPSIFRTHKEFLSKYSDPDNPGNWNPEATEKIRQHLSLYCAVARAKRKDWAYALPAPKQAHPSEWLVEMDPEFKAVYDHVCAKTIEEIQEDEELVKALKGDIDDDLIDDSTEDGDEDEGDSLSARLRVHLDRLEQFLFCPELDPLNGWNGLDFSKLKVPKQEKLIELLDHQFSRESHGKVIVFVRHINAVHSIYERLPEKYKSMSVIYHGNEKDGLNAFRFNPDTQIIIGVENSMNTGENLQIADRVIRMEIPWAAGDVEQGLARVFRPDFTNKYNRQFIYDDWIVVNDSLEIPKLCRLISSTIRKVQFDEYGSTNDAYRALPFLNTVNLNLKKFVDPEKAMRRYEHATEYFDAYHTLSNIQYAEFIEERSRYIDEDGNMIADPFVALDAAPELEGAVMLLNTPIVPNQNFVNDPEDDGLQPFTMWISEHRNFLDDPRLILDENVLVYTEFGYGYIYGMGRTIKGKAPAKVTVRLSNGSDVSVPTDAIFVATRKGSIKEDRIKKYIGVNSKASNSPEFIGLDPRETKGLVFRNEDGQYAEYIKGMAPIVHGGVKTRKKVKPAAVQTTPATPTAPAVTTVAPAPVAEEVEETTQPAAKQSLKDRLRAKMMKRQAAGVEDDSYVPENTGDDGQLHASLCVVSDSLFLAFSAKDPDSSPLLNMKFSRVKPFVGIEVKNLLEFDTAMAFIAKRFNIIGAEKFDELRKRFNRKTKLFNGQFEPTDNKFLALNYKPVKNSDNLKLYYIVEGGKLYLVFNQAANPEAASALLGKKPRGVSDKFIKYESVLMREVLNKRVALIVLNKVNAVAKIVNYDEIVEAIGNLTTV